MTAIEIATGCLVTNGIYEKVRDVLDTRFPELLPGLTWDQFINPARGTWRIPDPTGAVSKVELILADTPRGTVKVNNWWLPDLRSGERPSPHNHRWSTVVGSVIEGGYRDRIYWSEAGGVEQEIRTHEAGGRNVLPHHEFHEVVDVEPGTWTVFAGNRSQPGDWGYLDPETGFYTHNAAVAPDPNFKKAFATLNRC